MQAASVFLSTASASALGQELSLASQLRCVSGTFPPEGEETTQRCDLGHGGWGAGREPRCEKEWGSQIVTLLRVHQGSACAPCMAYSILTRASERP